MQCAGGAADSRHERLRRMRAARRRGEDRPARGHAEDGTDGVAAAAVTAAAAAQATALASPTAKEEEDGAPGGGVDAAEAAACGARDGEEASGKEADLLHALDKFISGQMYPPGQVAQTRSEEGQKEETPGT